MRELADELEKRGVEVNYAIHPVAGRMPGHMNVLLAEADVPYPQLKEMDEINPEFPQTDVALVIGANDVTNPAARADQSSPIYGMPILEVDKAQNIVVLKRSMNPGFAGSRTRLYYDPKTVMLFGDAKDSVSKLVGEVKEVCKKRRFARSRLGRRSILVHDRRPDRHLRLAHRSSSTASSTYNSLIRLRTRAEEGFSDIDVQLKRRHDLIPNLVETVKGYAGARAARCSRTSRPRAAPRSPPQGPRQQAQAENALTGALRQLFAVAEAYPDLKASQNFLELQDEITDTEDKIQAARRFYNMTVRDLNIKVETFPSRVIAGMANVDKREFFELDDAGRPRGAGRSPSAGSAGARQLASAAALAASAARCTSRSPRTSASRCCCSAGFLLLYAGDRLAAVAVVRRRRALRSRSGSRVVMVVVNLYMGDDLVLAVSGARRVESKDEAPELWRKVENLAITAGLPMPRLYIVPDDSPNAFAAGRKPEQAIVAVTSGLLERLDEEELEGVLAHEMSHVRNYDVRLMTYAAVLAGSIALISQIFLRGLSFGGGRRDDRGGANPIVLVRRAGRADPGADRRDRDPDRDQPPARVRRRRLGRRADPLSAGPGVGAADRSPATRQPLAALVEPGDRAPDDRPAARRARPGVSQLFSTHPPIEDRIARLEAMAAGQAHRHGPTTAARRGEQAAAGE